MIFHSVPLSLLCILSEYFDDFIVVLVLLLLLNLNLVPGNPPTGSFQDDVEIKHVSCLCVDVLSKPAVFGRKQRHLPPRFISRSKNVLCRFKTSPRCEMKCFRIMGKNLENCIIKTDTSETHQRDTERRERALQKRPRSRESHKRLLSLSNSLSNSRSGGAKTENSFGESFSSQRRKIIIRTRARLLRLPVVCLRKIKDA